MRINTNELKLSMAPEVGALIHHLWNNNKGLKKVLVELKKTSLMENVEWLLERVGDLYNPNYVPKHNVYLFLCKHHSQDIIRCRIKTTGINEISFNVKRKNFKLMDVVRSLII